VPQRGDEPTGLRLRVGQWLNLDHWLLRGIAIFHVNRSGYSFFLETRWEIRPRLTRCRTAEHRGATGHGFNPTTATTADGLGFYNEKFDSAQEQTMATLEQPVIISGVRLPVGKFQGSLTDF